MEIKSVRIELSEGTSHLFLNDQEVRLFKDGKEIHGIDSVSVSISKQSNQRIVRYPESKIKAMKTEREQHQKIIDQIDLDLEAYEKGVRKL